MSFVRSLLKPFVNTKENQNDHPNLLIIILLVVAVWCSKWEKQALSYGGYGIATSAIIT